MAHPNTEPRTESVEIDGHIITTGCRYRPDLQRWEPTASVRPRWNTAETVSLPCKPEEFQDTPDDAMGVAQAMVETWRATQHGAGSGQA